MEYITGKKYLPGALSDDAAALLKVIWQAGIWFPEWREMNRCQLDAFAELQRAAYIESTAYYGYRVKGRDCMAAVRQYQQERNAQLNTLYAGVDPLVAKWEARTAIIDFRLRPWSERVRVREAHLLLEDDIKLTLSELRKVG